jgi:PTH1 family peptidyl-tRNA hydrolase
MNVLGINVNAAFKKYEIPSKCNVIAIHDDLERKLGKHFIASQTSFKYFHLYKMFRGHNGLRSISNALGGDKTFTRIGIGISRPESRDANDVASYVLNDFSKEELRILEEITFP